MREEKKAYSSQTDEELMVAYQEDDFFAFDELYNRVADQTYGYLRRRVKDAALVDDIFQGTFIKFHQMRSHYRAPLPVLPWLFTICRSVMIDSLRSKNRQLERLEDVSVESLPSSEEDNLSRFQSSVLDGVAGAKRLTEEQQKALQFRYADELSFKEIAERLDTSPANVRQLISRALKKLKSGAKVKRGGK